SRTARARAAQTVRIPMQAQQTDSLNAATAAALLLYEAVRQRAAGL
ncbi:MAG: 23S rRNA (guanosine(2251)-2'-O)-methyltransferase RlmB, partial [Candidatus Dadabacteria bacterium]